MAKKNNEKKQRAPVDPSPPEEIGLVAESKLNPEDVHADPVADDVKDLTTAHDDSILKEDVIKGISDEKAGNVPYSNMHKGDERYSEFLSFLGSTSDIDTWDLPVVDASNVEDTAAKDSVTNNEKKEMKDEDPSSINKEEFESPTSLQFTAEDVKVFESSVRIPSDVTIPYVPKIQGSPVKSPSKRNSSYEDTAALILTIEKSVKKELVESEDPWSTYDSVTNNEGKEVVADGKEQNVFFCDIIWNWMSARSCWKRNKVVNSGSSSGTKANLAFV